MICNVNTYPFRAGKDLVNTAYDYYAEQSFSVQDVPPPTAPLELNLTQVEQNVNRRMAAYDFARGKFKTGAARVGTNLVSEYLPGFIG
ncbi:hypothetical protein SNEBB_000927 [Seison nebaliae]|nr:hypothetical protein SNEBB_000927 [Seison nebaliae]